MESAKKMKNKSVGRRILQRNSFKDKAMTYRMQINSAQQVFQVNIELVVCSDTMQNALSLNTREAVDVLVTDMHSVAAGVTELLARSPTKFPALSSQISHSLPCPSPSHFFVGRNHKIAELSRIFFPVVAIRADSNDNLETLLARVKLELK